MPDESTLDILRQEARSLGLRESEDALLDLIGDASLVLLGEATHGTAEFYRLRARISERLIDERGFDAIAVEADWPDALRVNRYLNASAASSADRRAEEALGDFRRFPLWMWRNTETAAFIERLRARNLAVGPQAATGFFGLDLYSLRSSMDAVIRYLSEVDPEAAAQARARYGCFDHLAEDPQQYGYAANFGMKKDCEEEVVRQLVALSNDAVKYASAENPASADALFYAQQNALVARNAEQYYRTMFTGRNASWNLRDTHMADTLDAVRRHL